METVEDFAIPGQVETDPTSVPLSTVNRVAITIARYLVGFLMTWGGLNALLDLAYHPLATLLLAKQYAEALLNLPYMVKVTSLQGIAGILLFVKCFVAFALTAFAVINFNTTLYHLTLQSENAGAAIVVCLLWIIVFLGEPCKLHRLFRLRKRLTILADAINMGLTKMAESCPGASYAKLSWLQAWHIRDETYSAALAELVNAQSRQPFAEHWGDGTTSSSDGQRFRAGGKAESTGHINPKYAPNRGSSSTPISRTSTRPSVPRS